MVGIFRWFAKLLGHPVDAMDKLQTMATRYGIEVLWDEQLSDETIAHAKLNVPQIEKACNLLTRELNIYPLITLKSSQLKRIVFATKLQVNNKSAGGVFSSKNNTIILSLDKLVSEDYARGAFHHELFHCIDYFDDYRGHLDPHWESLNDPGFRYSASPNGYTKNLVPQLGFMTEYSTSAVWEDKAELYQLMVVHNRAVYQHAVGDEYLTKKITRMKELLQAFSPGFDETFWLRRHEASEPMMPPVPVIVNLTISWQRVGVNDIFFVTREGSVRQRPTAFYSQKSLEDALFKLRRSKCPELSNLFSTNGAPLTVRFKTDRQTLNQSDLF